MSDPLDRLELSRLIHRFGLGPKPGEYRQLLNSGIVSARNSLLNLPSSDVGLSSVAEPALTDLGPFPKPNTPERITFAANMKSQNSDLYFWWLDRMALADHGLTERSTWFWHGHWATSIGKVEYALPMKLQNDTLRKYALGNFSAMTVAMLQDAALLFWLDAGKNSKTSPNENLARELMELFTLGIDNYTEDDVKAGAKALTGWQVQRSSGVVSFDATHHDNSIITYLNNTGTFNAIAVANLLTSIGANQNFIPKRMWFRFISTTTQVPDAAIQAFAGRDNYALIKAIASDSAMRDPQNSQVKAPLEWFISSCRALNLTPSKLQHREQAINFLNQMGQLPFNPPNVGGWPFDGAWLNAASAQYRFTFANYLVNQGDLSPLQQSGDLIRNLADWLGVSKWSTRTKSVLQDVVGSPKQLLQLALCAPEYVVNG